MASRFNTVHQFECRTFQTIIMQRVAFTTFSVKWPPPPPFPQNRIFFKPKVLYDYLFVGVHSVDHMYIIIYWTVGISVQSKNKCFGGNLLGKEQPPLCLSSFWFRSWQIIGRRFKINRQLETGVVCALFES